MVSELTRIAINNNQPAWFNSNIRHQIECLRTLRRKAKQRVSLNKLKRLQDAKDTLQKSITGARVMFEEKLICDFPSQYI